VKLSHKFDAITPTDTELENIKSGLFNIFRIEFEQSFDV